MTDEPVLCDRCHQPATVDRFTISNLASVVVLDLAEVTCETPGCVNELGSRSVDPPDTPGELTREDRRWLRRHQALADELAQGHIPTHPGGAVTAPFMLSCYGRPVAQVGTDERIARHAAEAHIRYACPEGPMPWARRIQWTRIVRDSGAVFLDASGHGEFLDHALTTQPHSKEAVQEKPGAAPFSASGRAAVHQIVTEIAAGGACRTLNRDHSYRNPRAETRSTPADPPPIGARGVSRVRPGAPGQG